MISNFKMNWFETMKLNSNKINNFEYKFRNAVLSHNL